MKLSQTGVGTVATGHLRPGAAAKVAIQATGDGVTTYAIEGRVSSAAPWVEVVAAGTADLAPALIDWLPELRLNVSAGAGTVTAYVATAVE